MPTTHQLSSYIDKYIATHRLLTEDGDPIISEDERYILYEWYALAYVDKYQNT